MTLFPITIQKLELHVHCADSETAAKVLSEVKHHTKLLNKLIMTFEELEARLTAANEKLDKIITEITTTPGVPQNIIDLVANLEGKLQAADDVNPDAEPPVEETQP